jgi:hypothetical protein
MGSPPSSSARSLTTERPGARCIRTHSNHPIDDNKQYVCRVLTASSCASVLMSSGSRIEKSGSNA